jgi:hypothetical protein
MGSSLPQCLQTIASSLIISAQWGHLLVYPLDTRGGSTAITTISNGTIAHSINQHTGLRPFLLAIMPPTMPAMITSKTYLNNGYLLAMITRLSLLYITYAYKWHCSTTCNLWEDSIPFLYSLEIGLYLSKLYNLPVQSSHRDYTLFCLRKRATTRDSSTHSSVSFLKSW